MKKLMIIFLLFLSCNKEAVIDEDMYSVEFDVGGKYELLGHSVMFQQHLPPSNIHLQFNFDDSEFEFIRWIFNTNKELMNNKFNDYEISYYLPSNINPQIDNLNFFIGINEENRFTNNNLSCYYLIWPRSNNSFKTNSLSDIKLKDFIKIRIEEDIEFIYTNLNKHQINQIFPRFKGEIRDGKVEKIQLDTSSRMLERPIYYYYPGFVSHSFFNRIRYVGLIDTLLIPGLEILTQPLEENLE